MAINPNIPLSVKGVDVGQAFNNALMNVQRIQGMRQSAQQAQQAGQMNDQTMRANALKQLVTLSPAVLDAANKGDIQSLQQLASQMPPQAAQEMLQMAQQGNFAGISAQAQRLSGLSSQMGIGGSSADYRAFQALTEGLTPEEQEQARRVKLGLSPRAGISAEERIALDPVTGAAVIEQTSREAAASEGGKLRVQAQILPRLRADIKEAEDRAASRGEALSDYNRSKVAMPGLLEVVGSLKELAPVATSTFGGRVFDLAAKELGFGATKGSTARAKYTSIIDNQILPLLKQTFGAAFTAVEGEKLRATLGDPDAAPAEKVAQLDAFIASKTRELETKQARVKSEAEQPQVFKFDAQGNLIQ